MMKTYGHGSYSLTLREKQAEGVQEQGTWCGYKITGLMLEHLLFKKLHNRNVVALNVLPSAIPTPLHENLPLLEAMLKVVF